jgi:ABC-type sugar transport system substrate-binding protein
VKLKYTLVSVVAIAAMSASFALAREVVIGVTFDKMIPFREVEKATLEKLVLGHGAKMIFENAQEDAQRQASQVDSFIAQHVDAIIAMPHDAEAIMDSARAAKAAGIPFVTFDQPPADPAAVTYHMSGDPCSDGRRAGEFFVKTAGGKPFKLLELQGGLFSENGRLRSECMEKALEGSSITIVAKVPTDWVPEKALAGTENALQAHPDLNGIYAPWNDSLQGVFPALKAKGLLLPVGDSRHITIVTIDGTPLGCKSVKDKMIDLDFAISPAGMATKAVEATFKALKKEPIAPQTETLPGIPYTPADVSRLQSQVWGCNQ